MSAESDKGPHLGRQVAGSATYDPDLLFPVPRTAARQTLPGGSFSGFGEDIWHAYELSWLDGSGIPQMYVGVFSLPAASPNIVESKSLKLYLNSLNSHVFASVDAAVTQIRADVSARVGADVGFEVGAPESDLLSPLTLDSEELETPAGSLLSLPDASLLQAEDGNDHVHTHRLRSLCPVTSQPDWATVVVETRGRSAERRGLLSYLLAFRNHQEFHEQCVERIYSDLMDRVKPDYLSVQALYTRRGGLDICPWRCSEDKPAPRGRLSRQ